MSVGTPARTVDYLSPCLSGDSWALEWRSASHAGSCSCCGSSGSQRRRPRRRCCASGWTCPAEHGSGLQSDSEETESGEELPVEIDTRTNTHLFCNFAAVVKVVECEDPLLPVVVLHWNITLQVLIGNQAHMRLLRVASTSDSATCRYLKFFHPRQPVKKNYSYFSTKHNSV